MTDQDNLRYRIAKVLDQNFNPDQYPIMTAMFRDYAQAIIDELGLTVEAGKVMGGDHGFPGVNGVRVVGKWEEQ